MTILFLGNFEAEFSSENYYKKTLESMGNLVIPQQENKATFDNLLRVIDTDHVDLFFWVHTHGWEISRIDSFLALCRLRGIKSFAYHLDLYLGIQRQVMIDTHPFFKVDYFFTVDRLMAEYLTQKGLSIGIAMPAGVFERDCYLEAPNHEKYPHEIIFTGSMHYHPEWPYRQKLINWLKETYGEKFAHYGGGGLPSVRGWPELNKLYASAKIVIGDTLCKDFKYPYYSSDRLFEVIGRGGFLIYPYIEGLEKFYTDFDDVVYYTFNDFENLKALIDHFLDDYERREIIRNRGFWRTRSQHTYKSRFTDMFEYLNV
jgi:hypothetical protein